MEEKIVIPKLDNFPTRFNFTKIAIDNGGWEKNPYSVVMREPFTTQEEYLKWVWENESPEDIKLHDKFLATISDLAGYVLTPNYNSATVGGNDALNPYPAFCEDDDIVPVLNRGGMGRVYSEVYDQQQQIIWIKFGIPEYGGIVNFFFGEDINKLASVMSDGCIGFTLGKLLGNAIGLAIALPILPLRWAVSILDLGNVKQNTRYVAFRNYMPIYYRMVNTILSHLSVGMKLYSGIKLTDTSKSAALLNFERQIEQSGLPAILLDGPDIFTMLDKRLRKSNINARLRRTDDLTGKMRMEDTDTDVKSDGWWMPEWLSNLTSAFTASAIGATDFIGFKIEKSLENFESFENNIGESELAQRLNGKVGEATEKKFSGAGGKTGIAIADSVISFMKGVVGGAADSLNISKMLSGMTGAGYFAIEDVWKNSSAQKTYSITIQLRSPYGNPVSIFQSIYVPLACLLAGAMPRSVGSNMYTSPFILNAYCKGMFAIPLGMISNMGVKRGLPEFGWNNDNLPTAVDVNLTIRDMSPTMHLTLADDWFMSVLARNDNLHEYLTTLSGVGLMERNFALKMFERKVNTLLLMKKNNLGSTSVWGLRLGHTNLAKFVGRFSPYSGLSSK